MLGRVDPGLQGRRPARRVDGRTPVGFAFD